MIIQKTDGSTVVSETKLIAIAPDVQKYFPDSESVNNALFKNERIYAATAVNNEWLALATNNNGVYITDFKGNIIQSFSRTEGLSNNNVLSIFLEL